VVGAWAARYLALLISVIGIPKDGDDRLFHCIYEACHDETIWEEGVAAKLLEGYYCKMFHHYHMLILIVPRLGGCANQCPLLF